MRCLQGHTPANVQSTSSWPPRRMVESSGWVVHGVARGTSPRINVARLRAGLLLVAGMSSPEVSRAEKRLLAVLFAAALLYSVGGIGYHFTMGFMSGHEFRQAQTAITTYYIDQQNNFSLLYETPILGKPWISILMEVPVYEWSVVGLSRATGWPHVVAARAISATCFYLTLPAVWLLLGRLAVPKPRRLLPLALILSAPLYLYYSRAFLMDSMALMASAWWLLAFVRTMDERRWGWLALAIVAGTLAALVKSAVLAVWLVPGAAYGAWVLAHDVRARTGWMAPLKTVLWGLATVAVGLGLLRCWVVYTDPIKAAHASAWIFTSKTLTQGNWGLFDFKVIFSAELWRMLLHGWEQAIMPRWLIGLLLVAGLALPGVRWRVLGTGSLFFIAQLLFPWAYAYQDYYFYACAIFLHVALGFVLFGLLDSRLPRGVVALVLLGPFAAQVRAYWQEYRLGQITVHQGGYTFTSLIRDTTPKNSVLVVAGADWAAMTPLYSQRKALMVRNGLEYDRKYLERALDELADEEVGALVVFDRLRENKEFIRIVASRFDMDAREPTVMSSQGADVYFARSYVLSAHLRLKNTRDYPGLSTPPGALDNLPVPNVVKIPPETASRVFPHIRPGPYQVDFEFGLDWLKADPQAVLSVHPNSNLWLMPPAGAKEIRWTYGIFSAAYAKPEARTDGVEFLIVGERSDGQVRRIFRRHLDPWQKPGDRGDQQVIIPYQPLPGEVLRFSTRPFESSAYDWAYTKGIEVK